MNKTLIILSVALLAACVPSQEEKEAIAADTCSIMGKTQDMDAAIRVEKMNDARERIGGESFLRGDSAIKESFEYGLCQQLVLNENYDETLQSLKDTKREKERLAVEQERIAAEEERIAAEKLAEERRIAAEKLAEEQRIADGKPTVEEEFHSNGKLKSRTNYQPKSDGGQLHGLRVEYYENGELKGEANYVNAELDGLRRSWYDNGEPRGELNYVNGELEGLSRLWHENGELWRESNWANGEQEGLARQWYKNGDLWRERCYKAGEKVDCARLGPPSDSYL